MNFFFKLIALSLIVILLSEAINQILDINALFYNSFAEQLTKSQIENIFLLKEKWKYINYVIIPVYLILKTLVIASIIYIGLFFSNRDSKFKTIWDLTLKAEFVFLLLPLFKIIWFYFFQTSYTLEDIQYFYPLSALNIIGYENLEPWYIYPLQTLNLFELGYWLFLGYLIGKETKTNMDSGFKIVASSYGPALLLWVVTIMFFTLNYS